MLSVFYMGKQGFAAAGPFATGAGPPKIHPDTAFTAAECTTVIICVERNRDLSGNYVGPAALSIFHG
jgi:hypothetical protein